ANEPESSPECIRPDGSVPAVHAAFYLWYGNPETDGRWLHWDHKVLPHWDKEVDAKHRKFNWRPPEEPHSPFYPERGTYRSLEGHCKGSQEAILSSLHVPPKVLSFLATGGVLSMAHIHVHVHLPSGSCCLVPLAPESLVADLKSAAQRALGRRFLSLVANGRQLDLANSLSQAGVGDGDSVDAVAQRVEMSATDEAVALYVRGGGVVTWGMAKRGGDSSQVQAQLRRVRQMAGTQAALAAVLEDGTVVTWGHPSFGGDSSPVQEQLRPVKEIQATSRAFAAVLEDGTVVTWGNAGWGGDSKQVQSQLTRVQQVQANGHAFAAILDGGIVVTWGVPSFGGDSSKVQEQLVQVKQIQSTHLAFAAILQNGSVVTWGDDSAGGDCSKVQEQLIEVIQIQATSSAFAALRRGGSVVTWGDPRKGGDSSQVQDQLKGVEQIASTHHAFAAVLEDETVVTWGDPDAGGDASHLSGLKARWARQACWAPSPVGAADRGRQLQLRSDHC
ncbi:unnamed protein product, partial [Effrenium voratum]